MMIIMQCLLRLLKGLQPLKANQDLIKPRFAGNSTILAVEELAKTRTDFVKACEEESGNSETDYDLSDRIKLSGFDDEFDEIPDIDEDVAEEQLRKEERTKSINSGFLLRKKQKTEK